MDKLKEAKDKLFECQQCGEIILPSQKHDINDCMKYSQTLKRESSE